MQPLSQEWARRAHKDKDFGRFKYSEPGPFLEMIQLLQPAKAKATAN